MKLARIIGGMIFLVMVACIAARAEEPKAQSRPKLKTRNILLVTTDGLRWQEVFGGADSSMFNKESGGVAQPVLMKSDFGGEKPDSRRKLLMPFMWSVIAKQGQIYGNVNAGSEVRVTNGGTSRTRATTRFSLVLPTPRSTATRRCRTRM